jgi:UDP-2,3-diacylglucosamine pyrophosphatase LpxH
MGHGERWVHGTSVGIYGYFRLKTTGVLRNFKKGNNMKEIIVNDAHVPFHDKKTFALFLGFIEREKPDKIYINGDWGDMYSISRFDKDPERVIRYRLQKEGEAVMATLTDIKLAGKGCKLYYIRGNHEKRMKKFLWNHPELIGLKPLRELYGIDILGYKYHEKGFRSGKFWITHGTMVRKHAGYTARAEFEKNGCSGISGHTHRDGKYTVRNRNGHFVWYENYCMCDLNAEYIEGLANWTQGWSMLHTVNKRQYMEQIAVINHRYIYGGKEWS